MKKLNYEQFLTLKHGTELVVEKIRGTYDGVLEIKFGGPIIIHYNSEDDNCCKYANDEPVYDEKDFDCFNQFKAIYVKPKTSKNLVVGDEIETRGGINTVLAVLEKNDEFAVYLLSEPDNENVLSHPVISYDIDNHIKDYGWKIIQPEYVSENEVPEYTPDEAIDKLRE